MKRSQAPGTFAFTVLDNGVTSNEYCEWCPPLGKARGHQNSVAGHSQAWDSPHATVGIPVFG